MDDLWRVFGLGLTHMAQWSCAVCHGARHIGVSSLSMPCPNCNREHLPWLR